MIRLASTFGASVRNQNRRLGVALAVLTVLYVLGVIAFIVAY